MKDLNKDITFKDKNICIEITEKEALHFNDETIKAFKELHEMGLMLAIDDFSMGQTSINYLQYNLFDIIKIDGQLVRGITTSQNCLEIISSIVELSSSLSIAIVAEFVENNEIKEALHEKGCDIYQGYLYSEAKPLEEKNN